MGATFSQLWPPAPHFTEEDVPDQSGKVFIVTGGSAGVGKELARILFGLNATVYIAARSEARVHIAISQICSSYPTSSGNLYFLPVDLADLDSVRQAADKFLAKEKRLDVLWNNAGVMHPPAGSRSRQGYELQLGVNCLAPFLFTKLLTPIMVETAKIRESGAVRVLWVSSSAAELFSPSGGIDIEKLNYKEGEPTHMDYVPYAVSKAGLVLLSQEYAMRYRSDGVVSVAMNPGNLKSDLRRHLPWPLAMAFGWMSWPPINGAYTELYAGFSREITMESSGSWVIPWGRIHPVRPDIRHSATPLSEGGTGLGTRFWDWSEKQVEVYTL
ncbi:Fc.00g083410.m01.CDS01 [Cosmosporella sp. VM-42]